MSLDDIRWQSASHVQGTTSAIVGSITQSMRTIPAIFNIQLISNKSCLRLSDGQFDYKIFDKIGVGCVRTEFEVH